MHCNCYLSLCPIQAGVPHGSLLGPTPFNIYINGIPSVVNDSNVAISVYADDTNISVRSGSIDIADGKINAATALLEPCFRKCRIRITKKFTITLFSRRSLHYRRTARQVNIFNEYIAWTNGTK
jgi:hypothetical protein